MEDDKTTEIENQKVLLEKKGKIDEVQGKKKVFESKMKTAETKNEKIILKENEENSESENKKDFWEESEEITEENSEKIFLKKNKKTSPKKKTEVAWTKVEIARNPKRPTSLDYIKYIFDDFMELHGDRISKDDKAICCGLAKIGNKNFTVIAQQKGRTTKENIERNFGMPNPESYRKAIRFMKQAEKFNRPVITFIDTKGAYPGLEAEEKGQGEAIAESMLTMAKLTVPSIGIVIGEGSSGGALAIGVSNKVYMLENAIYSILSPEGFASILWKNSERTKEAAEKMKLTSEDLLKFEVIDEIIKEPKEQEYTEEFTKSIALKIKKQILKDMKELETKTKEEIVTERYNRFRKIGG